MPDPHATTVFYGTPNFQWELVYFEDRGQWFIRRTDKQSGEQTYSAEGWDDKASALRAWDGTKITYVKQAPGQS